MKRRQEMFMKKWLLILLAVLLVLPGTALYANAQEISDPAITDAVEEELLVDPSVPKNRITVTTDDRTVTLAGTVSNVLAKERAARITATVKGVNLVVNRIDVEPAPTVTDSEIRAGILDALLWDPATESFEIGVAVDEGVASLTGTVESFQERRLVEKVAKGVRGVRAVENNIDVLFAGDRSAEEIEAEVRETLRWDALVDEALVDVEVQDDTVYLSGTVGSAAEKNRAVVDAMVLGVEAVDATDLEVKRWARDEAKEDAVIEDLAESAIRDAVIDALVLDPRVEAGEVAVLVDEGVVTLRGSVDSLKVRNAATQAARTRIGVLEVKNRLTIEPDRQLTDEQIAGRIHDALVRDPYLERYEVRVNVIDNTAYLSGSVDTYFDKTHAGVVASGTKGVTEVVNNLRVDDSLEPYAYDPYVDEELTPEFLWYDYRPYYSMKSDAEIYEDIHDQLFWSPFVDSDEVVVTVDDGIATLTGVVDGHFESNAAVENAFDGGATWVRNKLEVQ